MQWSQLRKAWELMSTHCTCTYILGSLFTACNSPLQVHDGWLAAVKSGHVTGPQVPPIPQEELHWLLQPSCESVLPQPWQRVHLLCVCKPHPSLTCSSRRYPLPSCLSQVYLMQLPLYLVCTCFVVTYLPCN